MIFLLLFSTCNAFAEEVRQSRVNQVSVTYQMKNRKWGFIDILTGYNSGPQYDDIYDDCYESDSPIFVMKDGLWGYVNRTNGEIAIYFQFSSVYGHPCFRHGYALVSNVVEGEDNSIRYDSFLRSIRIASGVTFSSVRQRVDDLRGSLRDFIRDAQVDETLFKAILRNMDCPRELFDHDLQEMSQGQRKKILLARSLCEPAHVFVWDEPLNYIDVFSRVQLETLIQQYQPTMLIVEHDKVFVERVATGVVEV